MNDLESRLRRDLPSVADAILADTGAPPASRSEDGLDLQTTTRIGLWAPPTNNTNGRRAIAAVAASLIVIVGLAGTWAYRVQAPQSDEPGAARQPADATAPPTPSTTTTPVQTSDPLWFTTMVSLLPPGFTWLGVVESNDTFVRFEAVDPTTTRTIHITMTRGPEEPDPSGATPIAQARNSEWTAADVRDVNISLADGRQLSVGCSVNALDEPDCPPINGTTVEPELIGELAVSLADQLASDSLPAPIASLDHVPTEQITTVVKSILDVEEQYAVSAPHNGASFAAYSDSGGPAVVHVRTVSGLRSTQAGEANQGEIELPGRRITWAILADGTIWTVTTNLDLPPQTGEQILDAAGEL